jgi:uncharacterized protein YutE (UPF0331/DUF86 family)
MVDIGVVHRRLEALMRYLGLLDQFKAVERSTFVAESSQHDLAERYLHLATEAAIDLANHIIADSGFETPESYRSTFAVLGSHGILEEDLCLRLQRWAGFRNILVHDYLDVDHGITFDAIQSDLKDLEQFAAVVAKLFAPRPNQ